MATTSEIQWTPELLAAAAQVLAQQAEAEKAAKLAESLALKAKYDALAPQLDTVVRAIVKSHDVKTWFKRDRKTKAKTDQVSGVGYSITGVMPIVGPAGEVREARVSVFVKWNPSGASVPEDSIDDAD